MSRPRPRIFRLCPAILRPGRACLRPARPGDGPAAWAVLRRAVHEGAAGAYGPAALSVWAPPDPPAGWEGGLLAARTVIGARRGRMRGFMTLGGDGHLDYVYVLPEEMGGDLAPRLLAAIEAAARARALPVLTTEASHLARRFLEKHGWRMLSRQDVIRAGVAVTNFRMERSLGPE